MVRRARSPRRARTFERGGAAALAPLLVLASGCTLLFGTSGLDDGSSHEAGLSSADSGQSDSSGQDTGGITVFDGAGPDSGEEGGPSDGASGEATGPSPDAGHGPLDATVPTQISFVQAAATSAATVAIPVAFANPVASHHTIIVSLDFDSVTQTMLPVTDSLNNTYVTVVGPVDDLVPTHPVRSYIAYATDIEGGSDVVTVTLTGAPATVTELYIQEYAGLASANAFDAHASATGTSTAVNGIASGHATTTSGPELIFAFVETGTAVAGTGFATRSAFNANLTEDEVVTLPGSYQATATMAAGTSWAILMATFRGATP
jgi:hypothetical protein